ncbi:MAG TPA: DMT family transporter [Pseudonocardiaceae bacterium]|nr:DMT family transporter [Pseudonocardiaceae bacterium]
MKPLRTEVTAVTFVLVWSSGYVMGALATQVIPPLAFTLWRFGVAAVVLATIARVRGERRPHGRQLVAVAATGIPLFAIQFGALYTAMADGMPAPTTALIACSSPLVVAVIGVCARWERLRPVQWVGIGLGVIGVAVTLADRVGRPPNATALAWALLGLAGLAAGTALQARLKPTAGPASIAATELTVAFVVLAVWAPLRGSLAIPLTVHALGTFAWVALVAGVGAPLLLFALIRQRGATRASSFLFAVPAVTALAAWPILGTPPGPLTVAGLAIVATALWLARARVPGNSPDDAAGTGQIRNTPAGSQYMVDVAGRTGDGNGHRLPAHG